MELKFERNKDLQKYIDKNGHMSGLDIKAWALKNNIGRNDLCPCGTGLKFKKCHLKI
jgi:uncharacterized protein YecA (UPF0149 family)